MSHHENLEAKIIHENELMSSVSISSSNTSPVKRKLNYDLLKIEIKMTFVATEHQKQNN